MWASCSTVADGKSLLHSLRCRFVTFTRHTLRNLTLSVVFKFANTLCLAKALPNILACLPLYDLHFPLHPTINHHYGAQGRHNHMLIPSFKY